MIDKLCEWLVEMGHRYPLLALLWFLLVLLLTAGMPTIQRSVH